MKKFTVGGLFSGVGGIELGFKQAGFEIKWANEFDKYSSKTYRLNHGDHLIEDDILVGISLRSPEDINHVPTNRNDILIPLVSDIYEYLSTHLI